ncbi:MAG: hypothetical protein D6750_08890, partial [Bacteroidetes bacterium]
MAWVLLGLALVWGQTATAWNWHAVARSPDAAPTSSYTPKWGWVRVVGDTVYIMGTYTGNSQQLGLPTTGSPISSGLPDGTAYVHTYLAAYNRQNGRLAWWMWFSRSSANCWGTDIEVDPQGRIFLLLISHHTVNWEYRDTLNNNASGSFMVSGVGGDRFSYVVKVEPQAGATPTVNATYVGIQGGGVGSYVDLKHLLQVGGYLYATGSFVRGGGSSLSLGGIAISIPLPLFSPIEAALIVRLNATTLSDHQVGQLYVQDGLLSFRPVRGHDVAYDGVNNQLRWLVETTALPGDLRYQQGGGSTSLGAAQQGLWAVSLNSSLGSPSAVRLAATSGLGESPFVQVRGDTLIWAIADNRAYTIQGNGGFPTTSGFDRLLLVEQALSSLAVVRSFESPRFGNGIRLYDLLGEREGRLLYLAG